MKGGERAEGRERGIKRRRDTPFQKKKKTPGGLGGGSSRCSLFSVPVIIIIRSEHLSLSAPPPLFPFSSPRPSSPPR